MDRGEEATESSSLQPKPESVNQDIRPGRRGLRSLDLTESDGPESRPNEVAESEVNNAANIEPPAASPYAAARESGVRRLFGKKGLPKSGEDVQESAKIADAGEPESAGENAKASRLSDRNPLRRHGASLAFGLTERLAPRFVPRAQQQEAEAGIYRQPHLRHRHWLSHRWFPGVEESSALYTQPVEDLSAGLYSAVMPASSARSLQLLNIRFGSDFAPPSKAPRTETGALLRQPDPVRHVRVRPSHLHRVREQHTAVTREIAKSHLVDGGLRGSGGKHTLNVSLGELELHDHRLFLPEHTLQCKLRTLAEQLAEVGQRDMLQVRERNISKLSHTLRQHEAEMLRAVGGEDGDDEAKRQRLTSMCVDLLQLRRQRDEHDCAERVLVRRMLHVWNQLKSLRVEQGFQATCCKLQVQVLRRGEEEDEADLTRSLEEELHERHLAHRLDGLMPHAFNEEQVRTEIAQRQQALRRAAGEDVLLPMYSEAGQPTPSGDLSSKERKRHLRASRIQLYCVLLLDGRVVGTAGPVQIDPHSFCGRLDSAFQLLLLQAPQEIALQLWERRVAGFADVLLAEVFLAVPEYTSLSSQRRQRYSFASEHWFKPEYDTSDAGESSQREVEEGVEIKMLPHRFLRGQVAMAISWVAQPFRISEVGGSNLNGAILSESFAKSRTRGAIQMTSGTLDPLRVREHVRPEDLDPNAPQDVPLLELLQRADHDGARRAFRLHWLSREMQWVRKWRPSEQLRLMELRWQRPQEWSALPTDERAVPQKDVEIPQQMRDMLQPTKPTGAAGEVDEEDKAVQGGKLKVRAWLEQVLARQRTAFHSKQFLMSTEDYVREPLVEQERVEINCAAILEKLAPRRKLLPQRRPRKTEPGSAETPRRVEVVIREGVDLPLRAQVPAKTRLLVECSFQGHSLRTEVKAGANPIWNQLIHLDLKASGGDWSQMALLNMRDEISFNLFDQILRSEQNDRQQNERTLRDERRWLGGFSLPFSTLYRNGKVEGVFPLSMPPILLGYKKDDQSESAALVPNAALALFVTVEPLLPSLKPMAGERSTTKDAKMQEFAKQWVKSVRKSLPKSSRDRILTVFVPSESGERVLACRYIRPQPPPRSLTTERQLLRFVSMIPHMDDAALGAKLDVWNTSSSFLDLGAGDEEEHALLLCNFFKAMDKEAFVLLGHGIPEGETAYVLTYDKYETRLWNAQTGKSYLANDPACPLTSVGCIFDDTNLWANIQLQSTPASLSWILGDNKCWRPFFGPRGFEPPEFLESVQQPQLNFRRTSDDYRNDVERAVEDRLQREFEDLRGHRPTDWNRSVGSKLRPLLKKFEEDASGIKAITEAEHDVVLERVRATYHIVGFPINLPYTDMQPLIDKLRSTDIWMSDGPNIQFVLTAYAHNYPNNVCSVWVYVASLEDLRAGAPVH